MLFPRLLVTCALALLCACTPAPEQADAPDLAAVPAAMSPESYSASSARTVQELMKSDVMPNADSIWRAVSYVANAEGVTETKPETDEDWSKLRESALALIAAGDELMDTNRDILTEAFDQASATYQYSPDEIKQLLIENPEPWQNYIRQMQDSTRMTLQAIELKDLTGLQDFGAQINEACEACHADYWYRPPA